MVIAVECTCTNEHLLHVHVDGPTIITVVCTCTCTTCTGIIKSTSFIITSISTSIYVYNVYMYIIHTV